MTLFDLTVGTFHILLFAGPIVAIYFTAKDSSTLLAVSLLWILFLFRGFGYNIIEREWGATASRIMFLFVILKSIPYVDFNSSNIYLWIIVIVVELIYELTRHWSLFGLREYLDVWRYDKSPRKTKATANTIILSWKYIFFLAFVSTLFTLIKVYYAFTDDQTPVYNNSAETYRQPVITISDSSMTYIPSYYDPSGYAYDPYLAWSLVVESGLTLVLLGLLRSFSDPSDDVWQSGLGCFVIYIYLNVCTVIPSYVYQDDKSMFALIVSQVSALFFFVSSINGLKALFEKDVSKSDKASRFAFEIYRAVKDGLVDIFFIFISEPVQQVFFIFGQLFVFYNINVPWYTDTLIFTELVQEITCIPLDIINTYVQVFFEFTSRTSVQEFIEPIAPDLGVIRMGLSRVLATVYNPLGMACNGATNTFVPTTDYVITIIMAAPWILACVNIMQFFPEAERLVKSVNFWVITLMMNAFSLLVGQVVLGGDVFLWFFVDTQLQRAYTSAGESVLAIQILMILSCFLMMYHRYVSNKYDKKHGIGTGAYFSAINPFNRNSSQAVTEQKRIGDTKPSASSGSSFFTKVVFFPVTIVKLAIKESKTIYRYLTSPAILLMLTAGILLYYAISQGSPIDTVQLSRVSDASIPEWAQITPFDRLSKYSVPIANLFTGKAKVVLYAAGMIGFLLEESPAFCIEIPGFGEVKSVLGTIINIGESIASPSFWQNALEDFGSTALSGIESFGTSIYCGIVPCSHDSPSGEDACDRYTGLPWFIWSCGSRLQNDIYFGIATPITDLSLCTTYPIRIGYCPQTLLNSNKTTMYNYFANKSIADGLSITSARFANIIVSDDVQTVAAIKDITIPPLPELVNGDIELWEAGDYPNQISFKVGGEGDQFPLDIYTTQPIFNINNATDVVSFANLLQFLTIPYPVPDSTYSRSSNTLCIGDLLQYAGAAIEDLIGIIGSMFDYAGTLLLYPLSLVPGFDIVDPCLAGIASLDPIQDFDLISVAGLTDVFRIPPYILEILITFVVIIITIKVYSLLDDRASPVSNSLASIFFAFLSSLIILAFKIKSWSDDWNAGAIAFTISFTWNSNINYYGFSLFLFILGLIMFFITGLDNKEASTHGRLQFRRKQVNENDDDESENDSQQPKAIRPSKASPARKNSSKVIVPIKSGSNQTSEFEMQNLLEQARSRMVDND